MQTKSFGQTNTFVQTKSNFIVHRVLGNGSCFYFTVQQILLNILTYNNNKPINEHQKYIFDQCSKAFEQLISICNHDRSFYRYYMSYNQNFETSFENITSVPVLRYIVYKLLSDHQHDYKSIAIDDNEWADHIHIITLVNYFYYIYVHIYNVESRFIRPMYIQEFSHSYKYYSCLIYTGNHYNILKYKDRFIFNKNDILRVQLRYEYDNIEKYSRNKKQLSKYISERLKQIEHLEDIESRHKMTYMYNLIRNKYNFE